jgi:hypothetical protein
MQLAHDQTIAELRNSLRCAGYSPIPVSGKRPASDAWEQKFVTNPDEIALWDNIFPHAKNTGILTRVTPTIDIDILNPEAAEAVQELARERFEERGYFMVRIGLPPKRAVLLRTNVPFSKIERKLISPLSTKDKPEKLELLADGQQVVVFGCHKDTGKPYSWHGGEPGKIKWGNLPYISADEARQFIDDAARLLVEEFGYTLLDRKPKEKSRNGKDDGEAGQEGEERDWQQLMSGVLEGHRLHDALRDLAAKFVTSGTKDGSTVNVLRALMSVSSAPRDARWTERCEEIPRLVSSAREKFGEKTAELCPGEKLFMSSGDFVKGFVAPEYIVDGLLLRGFSYSLTAATGAGKTAISLLLAASVALGKRFADLETEQGRVIYFAGENTQDIRQRWIALAGAMNFDADAVDVWFRDGPFKISTAAEHIKREVEAIGGAMLIIIDTSAAFFEGKDENDTVELRDHAARIRDLCKLPGNPTLLTNCHPVKSYSTENLIPRGSGAYLNEVDGNLTITKDDNVATLHWAGKLRGPEFEPLTFQLQTLTFDRIRDKKKRPMPTVVAKHIGEETSEAFEQRARQDEELILQAIADGARSVTEIARNLGWYSRDTHTPLKSRVHRGMKELKKARLIEVTARRTTITPKGEKVLKAAGENKPTLVS